MKDPVRAYVEGEWVKADGTTLGADDGIGIAIAMAVLQSKTLLALAAAIVSHGTDTLEETAYFLDLTVKSDKPIVLIGAQRNASEKDFDGPRNLRNAAREDTKPHTSDVETFKSGNFGVLGNADNDRVVFYRTSLRRQYVPLLQDKLPYVEIVAMYGGADGTMVRAAVAAGAKAVVIQALGWGNRSGDGGQPVTAEGQDPRHAAAAGRGLAGGDAEVLRPVRKGCLLH